LVGDDEAVEFGLVKRVTFNLSPLEHEV
jgi:hypothetical protein